MANQDEFDRLVAEEQHKQQAAAERSRQDQEATAERHRQLRAKIEEYSQHAAQLLTTAGVDPDIEITVVQDRYVPGGFLSKGRHETVVAAVVTGWALSFEVYDFDSGVVYSGRILTPNGRIFSFGRTSAFGAFRGVRRELQIHGPIEDVIEDVTESGEVSEKDAQAIVEVVARYLPGQASKHP